MGLKFWGSLGVLASVLAGAGAAGAADLAVKAPVYKAAPVILSDWAGFYLGINGGGGWGSTTRDGYPGSVSSSGGLVGGQLGYNWQFGSYVVGLETDLDGADISKTVGRYSQKTDELGTVRARAGYSFLPKLLAYGTVGYAYGDLKIDNVGLFQDGWVAGAGLEYKVWGPLIARAEYLHYGYQTSTTPAYKTDIDTVRGGLSYKF